MTKILKSFFFDKEQEGFNTKEWRKELYKTVKKLLDSDYPPP